MANYVLANLEEAGREAEHPIARKLVDEISADRDQIAVPAALAFACSTARELGLQDLAFEAADLFERELEHAGLSDDAIADCKARFVEETGFDVFSV